MFLNARAGGITTSTAGPGTQGLLTLNPQLYLEGAGFESCGLEAVCVFPIGSLVPSVEVVWNGNPGEGP